MPQQYIKRKTKPVATYGETGEENKIQWITKSVGTFTGGGGGETGTVDTEMSDTSTNAVQNKVIKEYVDTADENLTKVMPTDIAVKDNNKIILKHDGEELTGQTNPVEFKTINGQSLLGAGNLNIDAGSTVILEAGMEVTSELVEKLQKASQIFYRFTRKYNANKQIYKLPCEIQIYGVNTAEEQAIMLTIMWDSVNVKDDSTAVYLDKTATNFTAKFTSEFLVLDVSKIPDLFTFDGEYSDGVMNVTINSDWKIAITSPVQIANFTTPFTGLDLQVISASDSVYGIIPQDEEQLVILNYRPIFTSASVSGSIASIILIHDPVDYANDNFSYITVEAGKTATEIIQNSKSSDFVIKSQLKTINNESLVADGGGNIAIPTVQIEILEEGDN